MAAERWFLFSFLVCSYSLTSSTLAALSLSPLEMGTDWLALHGFKGAITSDPLGVLFSWNDTTQYCKWEGVLCSHMHPLRVVAIDLGSRGLAGAISPYIGNLTSLVRVNLSGNGFYGEIPPGIGHLRRLQLLDLSSNSLHGTIPINLTLCSELRTLDLDGNQLTGRVLPALGSLPKLEKLILANNSLTGNIPTSLGNLSSLIVFSLMSNHLEGSIPEELGNLASLEFFQVTENMLQGMIPTSLFNLSYLYYFSMAANHLSGSLPSEMGITLPHLENLYLGTNQFHGPIPTSLSNASGLEEVDFSKNKFSGHIPTDLGRLPNLYSLNLEQNQLEASDDSHLKFLDSLTNCSQLQSLALDHNRLGGVLPVAVANLSTKLETLFLGYNNISGSIPSGIENLVNMIELNMGNNLLTGPIPEGIGRLKGLQVLALDGGMLTGHIPSWIGNFTQLYVLTLARNKLEGRIPSSIGSLQNLEFLELSQNGLSSNIPRELIGLSSRCYYIDLSNNFMDGPLPSEIGSMKNLRNFAVSGNKLSGQIPGTLGNCEIMETLALDNNFFQGTIPSSLSGMRGLRMLDLSRNNLSGSIPEIFQTLNYLDYLNLSFNHLQGAVPTKGAFGNATAISLQGNDGLCGGIPELHLPTCPAVSSDKGKGGSAKLKLVIPIVGAALCLLLLLLFAFLVCKQKSRKKIPDHAAISDKRYPRVSYKELEAATENFSSHNLIGQGSYGSVYKGSLDGGNTFVAVKVLNLQEREATKSFIAECDALRNIRHRNLVKIHTCCSGLAPKGNDFKALVFEFMPNGSLDKWLHPKEVEHHHHTHLSLIQRLDIAIDVAGALEYLHHSCQPPIVHCDLKPSNVLLDIDMRALIGDFGLAKFLLDVSGTSSQDPSSSFVIRGTIGYVPPEYGAGTPVSTSGDVYSYGILLLELFTGRKPIDDMFNNGLDIHKHVEMGALSGRVKEIVDPLMLSQEEEEEEIVNGKGYNEAGRIYDCLVSVLGIGVSCSNHAPTERMNMIDAVTTLHDIRDSYLSYSRKGFIHETWS